MTTEPHYNVLFLCTGNSARSILGEAIVNDLGGARFTGYSAGSSPTGRVNPHALWLLERLDLPTAHLRSKSWDEFAGADAPRMDFVFTVCDSAASETCPVWPGQPTTAHWGLPDPAAVAGDDDTVGQAFRATFFALRKRIQLFMNLPLASLDRMRLGDELRRIGDTNAEDPA